MEEKKSLKISLPAYEFIDQLVSRRRDKQWVVVDRIVDWLKAQSPAFINAIASGTGDPVDILLQEHLAKKELGPGMSVKDAAKRIRELLKRVEVITAEYREQLGLDDEQDPGGAGGGGKSKKGK